jgi:hypothetical protein
MFLNIELISLATMSNMQPNSGSPSGKRVITAKIGNKTETQMKSRSIHCNKGHVYKELNTVANGLSKEGQ